ncbi:MAG: hypothetical protein ACK5NN_10365 [Sphingomonadaceae bacterium]
MKSGFLFAQLLWLREISTCSGVALVRPGEAGQSRKFRAGSDLANKVE